MEKNFLRIPREKQIIASLGVGTGRAQPRPLLSNDERGDRAGSSIELDSSSPSLGSDNCNITIIINIASKAAESLLESEMVQRGALIIQREKWFHSSQAATRYKVTLALPSPYMALPVPKLPVPVPNLVFLAMYDGLGAVLVQVIVIFQVSISNRSRRF